MKNKFPAVSLRIAFVCLTFIILNSFWVELTAQTAPVLGLHQNIPGTHAFVNAKIVVRPGKVLENAKLIIRDGYIENVGTTIELPADAVIHDMKGKTIYPGFIDLYSHFGIAKSNKSALSKKKNFDPKGAGFWNYLVSPENKAADQLVIDKVSSAKHRGLGFTTVVTFPEGATFEGQGAHVLLNDEVPQNTILQSDIIQAAQLSEGLHAGYGYYQEYPASLMGNIAMIRQALMDAKWYIQAWEQYTQNPNGQQKPEINRALEALKPIILKQCPLIVKAEDEYDLLRIEKLAEEFGIETWMVGSGFDYRKVKEIKRNDQKMILTLQLPEKPKVKSLDAESKISLRNLRHYQLATKNPLQVDKAGIEFCFSAAFLKKENDFLPNLRKIVKAGLAENKALEALTINPAKWLKLDHLLGTLQKGKLANFIITNASLFDDNAKIMQSWVAGKKFVVNKEDAISGTWEGQVSENGKNLRLKMELSQKAGKVKGEVKIAKNTYKISTAKLTGRSMSMLLSGKEKLRLSVNLNNDELIGNGVWDSGKAFNLQAKLSSKNETASAKTQKFNPMSLNPLFPEGVFGIEKVQTAAKEIMIRNATIWTSAEQGVLENHDLLIKDGKIKKIGKDLTASAQALIVDAQGKHVSAGIIDPHAHISAKGNINEYSHAITPEVRMEDILVDDDINVYLQLAGGVTTVCTLHGSANPIGGLSSVIKLKWGKKVKEMVMPQAPEIMKFALGENVKSPNPVRGQKSRYPQSRMGTIEIMKDAFLAALDYKKDWAAYHQKSKSNPNLIAPRKIIKYEHLLGVLNGETMVHCHAYRHDEILAFMKLAEEFGFKADAFIHTVEGYKVASELKAHGAMAIVFGDWWAYKMEAYDGTPYNAAILHNEGVVTAYHSDSRDVARRLNTEAAKAIHYGGVSKTDAIKMVTLNAAKMLKLEKSIGSLEVGKDADFVIWSASPLSTAAVCEQTWIEGVKYFDLEDDKKLRARDAKQRNEIIQQILNATL